MALSDIKALNKSHEIAFRNFIASCQGHFGNLKMENLLFLIIITKKKLILKMKKHS